MAKGVYKADGGVIRVDLAGDDTIESIVITGDFFIHPEDAVEGLEAALEGVSLEGDVLLKAVEGFFEKHVTDSPGIAPRDVVMAIEKTLRKKGDD